VRARKSDAEASGRTTGHVRVGSSHSAAGKLAAVHYNPDVRPAQDTPPFDAFTARHEIVRNGIGLSFLHEGAGGYPLLLLHGYPETKRIWWRNIAPLAAAGFEVIAPDLRGYGDSDLSADDAYDLTIDSRDVHALVHDVLGHERCAVVAGDIGGVVAVDLAQRFDGFVERLCFFNTVPPPSPGFDLSTFSALRGGPTGDYQELQGARPDEPAAMLATPLRAGNGSRRCTPAACGPHRARSHASRSTS